MEHSTKRPVKIHDISIRISADMPTYPGDPKVSLIPELQISKGDSANVSRLCMGDHTGTHLDPPVHFVPGGKTVDELNLDTLYGSAHVLDLTRVTHVITAQDLESAHVPEAATRLLFKTRNSNLWAREKNFDKDFVGLDAGAAQWLVDRGIRLVGIDYLSVELFGAPQPVVHRTLLGAAVIVVEGLDLSLVAPGEYTLACLPLKIERGDGGPCRAILIEPSQSQGPGH